MGHERIILCSGVTPKGIKNPANEIENLNLWKTKDGINVTLPVNDLDKKFLRDIPPAFLDLIEIASYVYTADQIIGRGGKDVDTFGAAWRRSKIFHVPVRATNLWKSPKVQAILADTLSFLSDDFYEFHFYPAHGAPEYEQYLNFSDGTGMGFKPQIVALYSGGLDSLAGAIHESLNEKKRVALVSHRPLHKFNSLRTEIAGKLAERAEDLAPLHVPVRIHKDSEIGSETTQRSRSFLYASLAATVAKMVGLNEIRFYENGVVSLNLPPCEQIIGSRATRTTHPRVLRGFEALFTEIGGADFTVRNPFEWMTKGEIVQVFKKHGCEDLIKPSRSCASTWERTNQYTHCGICSQCVDRRVAMIATDADRHDPVGQYEIDIVKESIPVEKERIMMVAYFERANEFRRIKQADQLLIKYPEVSDALPHYPKLSIDEALGKILTLHQRHAVEVRAAAVELLRRHADDLLGRALPDDCLVRILNDTNSATLLPAVEAKPQTKPQPPTVDPAGEKGRLRWDNDFNDVYVDGVHYDLTQRDGARFCIRYLVMMKAFEKAKARHIEKEINKYVEEQAKRVVIKSYADGNLRIHHYFNGPGNYPRLCKALVKAAGRNRCFFLQT